MIYFVLGLLLVIHSCSSTISNVVNSTSGMIHGMSSGASLLFLGIPYAKPPIGSLRFKPPEDPVYQEKVNATDFGNICMQPTIPGIAYQPSEDCLFLNVLTTESSSSLPVMVFIHGGGYWEGASTLFPDGVVKNFLSNDVVLVSMNYRLSVFGFFNSNSTTFPANNGMKDQVKALEWVKRNIAQFGGDPSRVTIFGESAGASSVSLLTYSPLAKGLFHQVIQESGSAFNPWAINGDRYRFAYNPSFNVSKLLSCSTGNDWSDADLDTTRMCLENKTTAEIFDVALHYPPPDPFMGIAWAPVVDGEGGFLPDYPENLNSQRSDINMMIGNNHDEFSGTAWSTIAYNHSFDPSNFNSAFFDMYLDGLVDVKVYGNAVETIKEILAYKYKTGEMVRGASDPIDWINATTALMSDFSMDVGVRKDVAMAADILQKSKLYLYSFNYVSQNYMWAYYWKGVIHTCELPFVFASYKYGEIMGDFAMGAGKFDSTDQAIVDQFGKMWTNFAISGDPNKPKPITAAPVVAWEPVTFAPDKYIQYYAIDIVSAMKEDYHYASYNLWELVAKLKDQLNPNVPTAVGPTCGPGSSSTISNLTMGLKFIVLFVWFLRY